MTTIVITDFHPFVSRNILSAPFLGMCAATPDVRVVVVCPEKKQDFLRKEYGGANVFVHGVSGRIRRRDAFFKDFAMAAVQTRSLHIMKKMRIGFERPWFIRMLAPCAFFLRPFIPFLYRLLIPRNAYAALFEKWSPTFVFAADIFGSADCRIAHEARCRGIPTVGMVRSWDNLTTKGGFRVIPDVLVVNNDIIKKEAIKIHHIPEKIIRVVGVPHYDRYRCPARNALQDEYKARGKKIILYSPLGDRIIKVGDGEVGKGYDRAMIFLLARLIPPTHILFVRLPPTDTVALDGCVLPPNVFIERPGTVLGASVQALKVSELSRADDAHLVETICASALVLTVFSSIAVDALVLGTPVILLGFDPVPTAHWKRVARLHELDHIRPLIEGGIPAVYSEESLRREMMKYLTDQDADRAVREKIADAQRYETFGAASKNLLQVVLSAIKR